MLTVARMLRRNSIMLTVASFVVTLMTFALTMLGVRRMARVATRIVRSAGARYSAGVAAAHRSPTCSVRAGAPPAAGPQGLLLGAAERAAGSAAV